MTEDPEMFARKAVVENPVLGLNLITKNLLGSR
jgi:hypothetical protein